MHVFWTCDLRLHHPVLDLFHVRAQGRYLAPSHDHNQQLHPPVQHHGQDLHQHLLQMGLRCPVHLHLLLPCSPRIACPIQWKGLGSSFDEGSNSGTLSGWEKVFFYILQSDAGEGWWSYLVRGRSIKELTYIIYSSQIQPTPHTAKWPTPPPTPYMFSISSCNNSNRSSRLPASSHRQSPPPQRRPGDLMRSSLVLSTSPMTMLMLTRSAQFGPARARATSGWEKWSFYQSYTGGDNDLTWPSINYINKELNSYLILSAKLSRAKPALKSPSAK